MPIEFHVIPRVMVQTLDHYNGRGRKTGVINETTERTIGLTAEIFKRTRKTADSGNYFKDKLQFNKAETAQWVGAGQKIESASTPPITWTEWPRRFLRYNHFIDYSEIDTQKDEAEILNDLVKQAREDSDLSIVLALHEAFNSRDGNYAHDGTSNYLQMFGWRHIITPDGLRIDGQSAALGGLNPTTQPLWRNPFINPTTDSLGGRGISSVTEIRRAVHRMFQMLNYTGVNGFGKLAASVRGVPEELPFDNEKSPKDVFIAMCDPNTYLDAAEVFQDRQDSVARDEALLRPMIKGVPVQENERMGIDATYGYGYDSSGNPLWDTAPANTFANTASGIYKGYGEFVVVNTQYVRHQVHSDHAPAIYDAYKPEGMAGVAYEGDYWCQTTCSSRRRAGGYIGPFATLNAA